MVAMRNRFRRRGHGRRGDHGRYIENAAANSTSRRHRRIREDRRSAHPLRQRFCTMLGERGVALEVIRELLKSGTA